MTRANEILLDKVITWSESQKLIQEIGLEEVSFDIYDGVLLDNYLLEGHEIEIDGVVADYVILEEVFKNTQSSNIRLVMTDSYELKEEFRDKFSYWYNRTMDNLDEVISEWVDKLEPTAYQIGMLMALKNMESELIYRYDDNDLQELKHRGEIEKEELLDLAMESYDSEELYLESIAPLRRFLEEV